LITQFDPENHKSILELQAERAALQAEHGSGNFLPMQPSASISTLRQKLQDKIDSLRRGRKAQNDDLTDTPAQGDASLSLGVVADGHTSLDDGSVSGDDNDTLASRDEMLEARRKRRGEVRDNRRRRRKEERRQGKAPAADSARNKTVDDKSKSVDFKAKPGKVSVARVWLARYGSMT
jgi:hypothetical protein